MATPASDSPVCDHTSVGILVFRDGKLLLIDRKQPPFGLAAPAGHVDAHGNAASTEVARYEQAAKDELSEETGLVARSLSLVAEGRKDNPCRRTGGSWHYWRIYRAEAVGLLKPSATETRGHLWCTVTEMEQLLSGRALALAGGQVAELEPVWREWFRELRILDLF